MTEIRASVDRCSDPELPLLADTLMSAAALMPLEASRVLVRLARELREAEFGRLGEFLALEAALGGGDE